MSTSDSEAAQHRARHAAIYGFRCHWLLIALALSFAHAAASDAAAPCGAHCRTCGQGQYWRISSINAPLCDFDPSKLEYFLYNCHGGWVRSSYEAFLAADHPAVATSFFMHGYFPQRRITIPRMVESSTEGGWLAYRKLCPPGRPFRLVLWSWRGEREQRSRLVPNMRKKMAWAELQGWYMAWVVDQMNPLVPVGLVADSLGASGVTSALHVLGGGSLAGRTLERVHPDRLPLRAALVAGTMNNYWLLPGQRHGLALSQVERMIITVNPRDRMLKLYTLFEVGGGARAVGETGIPNGGRLGPYRDRVVYFYVTEYLGGKHWWRKFMGTPAITARLSPYAFPPPVVPAAIDLPEIGPAM